MDDFEAFLLDKEIVTKELLDDVSQSESASTEPIYYKLLRKNPSLEVPLWQGLAEFLQIELVDPEKIDPEPMLARAMPAGMAHQYAVVPISQSGNTLEIALADPAQFEKCQEFSILLSELHNGKDGVASVVGHLAMPRDIAKLTRRLYGIGAATVEDMLESETDVPVSIIGAETVDLTRIDEADQEDAAIIRFVNQLLLEAVKIGASDIHIEPFEKDLVVRYRIDGMLQKQPVPERLKHLEAAIVSRIKIMAHLDISEKRLPQDGQIRLTVMGRGIDVRVSVLPTVFGQGLSLRLLDQQMAFRHLDNIGMPDDYLNLHREVIKLSHGVILVTGPTGSGKSTTLYASISEISSLARKIITVEDPVEYQLEGITQIQVKPAINLTFANVLRNIVRHDPDVIMVGEIRDTETAQIAISAAMTGHLVFSTLHTNDAPSAPVRLLEMGVEPFLVSSAVESVVAQRLVRILCEHCKAQAALSGSLPDRENKIIGNAIVYESIGCSVCRHSGYRGRTAIFEMFTLNDEIKTMILARANANDIRREAIKMGMRSLHDSGLMKARDGITSLAEVYRVARHERIDMKKALVANDQ